MVNSWKTSHTVHQDMCNTRSDNMYVVPLAKGSQYHPYRFCCFRLNMNPKASRLPTTLFSAKHGLDCTLNRPVLQQAEGAASVS